MIKHIVMWNFAESAEGADRATNLRIVADRLAGLSQVVPGILKLEPVIPVEPFEHSYDLVLYSEFESPEALQAYATHPEHVALAGFIAKVRTARVCVDYKA